MIWEIGNLLFVDSVIKLLLVFIFCENGDGLEIGFFVFKGLFVISYRMFGRFLLLFF